MEYSKRQCIWRTRGGLTASELTSLSSLLFFYACTHLFALLLPTGNRKKAKKINTIPISASHQPANTLPPDRCGARSLEQPASLRPAHSFLRRSDPRFSSVCLPWLPSVLRKTSPLPPTLTTYLPTYLPAYLSTYLPTYSFSVDIHRLSICSLNHRKSPCSRPSWAAVALPTSPAPAPNRAAAAETPSPLPAASPPAATTATVVWASWTPTRLPRAAADMAPATRIGVSR
jgi:hypothetical protein